MRKTLCALLACFVVLCGVSACRADYDNEGRDGFTEAGAYLIDSIDDLKLLRDRVNAATEPENRYYRLEIDMNLTQETTWEPIGYGNPFKGHFDGNGHTIYVNISRTSRSWDSDTNDYFSHRASVFGWVSSSGYGIKNLNVNATQIAADYTGGIAYGLTSGTIENCHFTGSIGTIDDRGTGSDTYNAGGIVGYMSGGSIKNCTVNAAIYAYCLAGGIAAQMDGGSIENCEVLNNTSILSTRKSNSDGSYAGGIAGYANIALDDSIKNCSFNGTVQAKARDSWNYVYTSNTNVYCGGIVGYLSGGTLQNNHVLSDADIFSDYTAGGIAGLAASGSTLESNDTAVGARAQANGEAIGGIVGLLNVGTVKGNTSYTAITGTATHQGGVIGKLEGTTASISGNKYNGAQYGIGFDASGFPSELGCERVGAAISITTSSPLPAATAGTSYSQKFASDSEETLTWSHVSGDLPAGLTLNSSTGTLSGTPSTAGTFTFTVGAADQYSSASKIFTLTVNLVVTTDSVLPNAVVGSSYTQTLRAAGANSITWTRTAGSLPAGLTLNANGTISGTPTTAGTSDFTVQADAGSNITSTKSFRITVEPAQAITITTTSLPSGKVGTAYSAALAASESGVTWSVSSGSLPSGLSLNSSTGVISGTPTSAGSSTFTVRAAKNSASGTRQLTITVSPADTTPTTTITITTASLPSGTAGTEYRAQLASSVSNAAWSLSSGSLPAGLSLTTAGVISGTPTSAGTSTFTVRASSGNSSAARTFSITINAATLSITTNSLPSGTVGEAYRYSLQASASVSSWSVTSGSLPDGLSLDSSTGLISGTLSRAGSYTFTVRAANAYANTSRSFTIVVTGDDTGGTIGSSSSGGGCNAGLGLFGILALLILKRH